MWILVPVAALILFSINSSKGRQILNLSSSLITVSLERFKGKEKILTKNINNISVCQIGDIILNTKNISKYYDVICFESKSIKEDIKHNYNPSNDIEKVIPVTFFRQGVNLCSVPFRPKDFGCDILFVSIRNMNEVLHSVYKFSSDMYINLLDIIDIYENDKVKDVSPVILAEAYD